MKKWVACGLCAFIGLGAGYLIGVKTTKERADEDCEQKIAEMREIYRNERKSKNPKKDKPGTQASERPEVMTKTSIDIGKLSERREKAEAAARKYAGKTETPAEDEEEEEPDRPYYIVDAFPEDSDYAVRTLKYYSDGVLTDDRGAKWTNDEIETYIGEDILKLMDSGNVKEAKVRNDETRVDYTILYDYNEYASVAVEEPYKTTL